MAAGYSANLLAASLPMTFRPLGGCNLEGICTGRLDYQSGPNCLEVDFTSDAKNKAAAVGLRRAVWAMERVPGMRAVGFQVDELFDTCCKQRPKASEAMGGYGPNPSGPGKGMDANSWTT